MSRLILLPLLVAISGPQAAPKPAATPKAPVAAESQVVPLYLSEKRALAMLRIGDNAPVPVVFDTGTNGNLLDTMVADRLGLPNSGPSPSIDGSTGKPVPGHDSFVSHARLGGVAIADARATVMNHNETDEVGIFGPNSFPDRLVEMDGPRGCLVIRRKTADALPAGPALPYLGEGGTALPSASLDFGDLTVPAILDTGNDSPIILPLSFVDKLHLAAAPIPVGYAVSAAGRQPILAARLAGTVRMGSVTIDQPKIYFMQGGRPNIGLPVLRQIKVIYDPSGARAWIASTATITAQ